ncbi:TetR/AcrR family transcriptional regulator [Mycolicibacterium sp. XJ1819]
MTAAESVADDGTVRDRLIRAADAEIAERGTSAVQMEAVALRAGVSRATAFRQLGSVSDMLMHVGLLRARRHVEAVHALMAEKTGAFAKLEALLLYSTRELPTDPSFSALIPQRAKSVRNPRVHRMTVEALGPFLDEGWRSGELRDDVPTDEIVDFLLEQLYIAAEDLDRSDAAVRRRVRNFIIPALAAPRSSVTEHISVANEADEAIATAIAALTNLADRLRQQRR